MKIKLKNLLKANRNFTNDSIIIEMKGDMNNQTEIYDKNNRAAIYSIEMLCDQQTREIVYDDSPKTSIESTE